MRYSREADSTLTANVILKKSKILWVANHLNARWQYLQLMFFQCTELNRLEKTQQLAKQAVSSSRAPGPWCLITMEKYISGFLFLKKESSNSTCWNEIRHYDILFTNKWKLHCNTIIRFLEETVVIKKLTSSHPWTVYSFWLIHISIILKITGQF